MRKKTELSARKEIDKIEDQFRKGIITRGERHNKIIDVWTTATDDIAKNVFTSLEENLGKDTINPVYLMMDSGARGNRQQVRQLCGMRGLMAKPLVKLLNNPFFHHSGRTYLFWNISCLLTELERV